MSGLFVAGAGPTVALARMGLADQVDDAGAALVIALEAPVEA